MIWRTAKRAAFVLAIGLWFVLDIAESRSRKIASWLEDRL